MKEKCLPDGVYPTMLTPYTPDNKVDYEAVALMVEWYISQNCDGIFANCLSSEIDYLTLEERKEILSVVMKTVNGRVPVVASGMTVGDIDSQIEELRCMAECGPDAVILIASRMIGPDESEELLKEKTMRIMDALPDCDFGFYECPVPYSRQLSPEFLRWCAGTDRFVFFKDTSCSIEAIKLKLDAVIGSRLKLFNANSATLLESLKYGAAGLSGVMANIHPNWYSILVKAYIDGKYDKASKMQNIIGGLSIFQYQKYPLNAKYYMALAGVSIKTVLSRNRPGEILDESNEREIEQFFNLSKYIDAII